MELVIDNSETRCLPYARKLWALGWQVSPAHRMPDGTYDLTISKGGLSHGFLCSKPVNGFRDALLWASRQEEA